MLASESMRPSPTKSELARRKNASAQAAFEETPQVSHQKPEPAEYGLSSDFDLADFRSFMQRRERQTLVVKALIFVALVAGLYFIFRERIEQAESWAGHVLPFAFSYFLVFVLPLTDFALKAHFGDAEFIRCAQGFRVALNEWDHFKTVSGVGYWRELRGTDLEWAAARLFRDHQWSASTTAVTGDGGVDLVLRFGHKEFYCQCKGHTKPVSVAAVREIAGVCAASNAIPMLIVVNGVTGPAMVEARKLSVIVLDSADLAAFARGEFVLG